MRFWLSWWQPGADYRPLVFPVAPPIIGWWCTGRRAGARAGASLCVLVDAPDEQAAKAALEPYWPEAAAAEWRFCEQVAADWDPGERFPKQGTSAPRTPAE